MAMRTRAEETSAREKERERERERDGYGRGLRCGFIILYQKPTLVPGDVSVPVVALFLVVQLYHEHRYQGAGGRQVNPKRWGGAVVRWWAGGDSK